MEKAMSKFKLAMVAAVAAFGLGTVQHAEAAVAYRYTTDKSSYTAPAAGQSVSVQLFLQEVLTGGSSSLLAANRENGVATVAMRVARANGDSIMATLAQNSGAGSDFTGPEGKSVTAALLTFSEAAGTSDPNVTFGNTQKGAVVNDPALSRIYMGTLTITAGANPSTFNLLPYDAGGGNTLSGKNFYDLDFNQSQPAADAFSGANSNPTSFTVSLVPEPATFGLLGATAAIGLLRRRRA